MQTILLIETIANLTAHQRNWQHTASQCPDVPLLNTYDPHIVLRVAKFYRIELRVDVRQYCRNRAAGCAPCTKDQTDGAGRSGACGAYGGQQKCVRGFGTETCRKETTCKF